MSTSVLHVSPCTGPCAYAAQNEPCATCQCMVLPSCCSMFLCLAHADSALAHAVLEPAGPAITRSTAKAPTSTRQANGTAPGLPSSHKAVRLAVLPHECNFTGQRIDLRLVSQVKLGAQLAWLDGQPRPHAVGSATAGVHDRWLVMLDAAKSCATGPPDLSQYPADMVALSYYKIFGYPTGTFRKTHL